VKWSHYPASISHFSVDCPVTQHPATKRDLEFGNPFSPFSTETFSWFPAFYELVLTGYLSVLSRTAKQDEVDQKASSHRDEELSPEPDAEAAT
jgi:hypothetical protein